MVLAWRSGANTPSALCTVRPPSSTGVGLHVGARRSDLSRFQMAHMVAAPSGDDRPQDHGYFFGWVGLDPSPFFENGLHSEKAASTEWRAALLKIALGTVILYAVVPALPEHLLLRGWAVLIGLAFMLHFGLFHLGALIWRRLGVPVRPIMLAPVLARSVAEFWGRRWNLAFRDVGHRFIFLPLAVRWGPRFATLAVFAFSGCLHELVISLPAGGGYGLPFAYFVFQGTGAWFERSWMGRTLGLGEGTRGWLFTVAVAAFPALFLFHPPFLRNVILPLAGALMAI